MDVIRRTDENADMLRLISAEEQHAYAKRSHHQAARVLRAAEHGLSHLAPERHGHAERQHALAQHASRRAGSLLRSAEAELEKARATVPAHMRHLFAPHA